jgi:hypothetical protein
MNDLVTIPLENAAKCHETDYNITAIFIVTMSFCYPVKNCGSNLFYFNKNSKIKNANCFNVS